MLQASPTRWTCCRPPSVNTPTNTQSTGRNLALAASPSANTSSKYAGYVKRACFCVASNFKWHPSWKKSVISLGNSITVEPLTNDHPHQRPSLSYDHISCDGQWFLFVYESLTSDHPSYTTTSMWFWGWSYKRGSTVLPTAISFISHRIQWF